MGRRNLRFRLRPWSVSFAPISLNNGGFLFKKSITDARRIPLRMSSGARAGLWIVIGVMVGAAIGASVHALALGVAIGAAVGVLVSAFTVRR